MTETFQSYTPIPYTDNALIVTDPVTSEQSVVVIKLLPEIYTSQFNTAYPNNDIRFQGQLFDCEYLNKTFYVGGYSYDYTLQVTENLVNWTSSYAVSSSDWAITRLAASDNMMVGLSVGGVSQGPIYSYDGYNWFSSSMDHPVLANSVCWSPTLNRFVAVGDRSTAWYSDDGLRWKIVTSSTMQTTLTFDGGKDTNACVWNSVIWDNNNSKFIAVGERETLSNSQVGSGYSSNPTGWTLNTGSMMTSTDGINWNITTTVYTGSTGFRKVVNGNGTLVAITSNNILHTSTNGGNSWSKITLSNTNRVYDIAYSPSLNKFYAPYGKTTYVADDSASLFFFTSSNGIDWGVYQNEINKAFASSPAPTPMKRIVWASGSNKFIATDGVGPSLYVSDANGTNFRSFAESRTAWGYFIQTPNNTIYDTPLLPSTGSTYTVFEPGDYTTWVEFDLALGVGTPFDGPSTYYIGTSSFGIIIDSASLSSFSVPSINEVEDVEIGNIRYLRELSGVSEDYHYGYYETATTLPLSASNKSTFSASLKSAGRDYVVVYYGAYGPPSNTVAMILNLNSGIIEYQEDSTNINAENSYYLSNGRLKFEAGPTLTSKGNDYWELAFKVGFDLNPDSYNSYRTIDSVTLTASTSTPPVTASLTAVPERTYIGQENATVTSPRPDYWWRADSGLTTNGWTAVSGSINFTFMNVTTANSTVGAYFSQSWGSSSALPADVRAKHIFIRLDDVQPSTFTVPGFGVQKKTGTILGATGSGAIVEYYIYEDNGVYQDNKFKIINTSGSYWPNYSEGYSSGSRLIYTDFSERSKPANPRPFGYIDDWSPNYGLPWGSDTFIVNYKHHLLWSSGSTMTIGRGPDIAVEYILYNTYIHMYVKELAIFTSSLTVGEAHAFSQEMLARWP